MTRPFALLALTLVMLVAGCDAAQDLFAPKKKPLGLHAEVVDSISYIAESFDGLVSITCHKSIELRATGDGKAVWTSVRLRRYTGLDRTLPVSDFDHTVAVYPHFFRRGYAQRGKPDTLIVGRTEYQPFRLEAEVSYVIDGQTTVRTLEPFVVVCGPEIDSSTPPPVTDLVAVTGSDLVVETGDTVLVQYTVSGASPIWTSQVKVTGPFTATQKFREDLAVSTARTAKFVVPRHALAGTAVTVELTAVDAAGRVVTASEVSALVVADTTPPTIIFSNVSAAQTPTLIPLQFEVHITENNDPEWLVWELDGEITLRDSLQIFDANAQFEEEFTITAPDAWGGLGGRLRVFVRDKFGNASDTVSSAAGGYSWFRNIPAEILGSGPGGGGNDVVYDAVRNRIYATHTSTGKVTAVDALTGSVLATLDVPPIPGSLDISPSGDSLFVTQSVDWAISVIDLNTLALLTPIEIDLEDSLKADGSENPPYPNGLRVTANGKLFVMLHLPTSSGHRVIEVDASTGAGTVRTDAGGMSVGVSEWWKRSGVSADRERLVLLDPGCPRVYRSSLDSFGPCAVGFPAELEAAQVSVDDVSGRVLVGARVFDANLNAVSTLPFTGGTLMPGGDFALIVHFAGVSKIRVSDGRVMLRIHSVGEASRLILLNGADGLAVLAGFYYRASTSVF
jgi:hypothetical protein